MTELESKCPPERSRSQSHRDRRSRRIDPRSKSPKDHPMKRTIITAILYTAATTVLFGLVYPLVVTGVAQLLFKDKANGQLIYTRGTSPRLIGSHLIGQPFTAPAYFHSPPSAAGNGYDPPHSGGSNYPPTNQNP